MAVVDYPVYGAIYGGDISFATVNVAGGGLDIEGMVGDTLEFGLFFDYQTFPGYTFSGYVILTPSPLQETYPITVSVTDAANGLYTVSLSKTDTTKIGPVSGRPWFLRLTDPAAKERTILMGKFQLNKR